MTKFRNILQIVGLVLVVVGFYFAYLELFKEPGSDIFAKYWHLLNRGQAATEWKFEYLVLPAGMLVFAFSALKEDASIANYFRAHPKIALLPFKISLAVGLFGSLMYACFSHRWGAFVDCLMLSLFLSPPYKKLLYHAATRKYPIACIDLAFLPMAAVLICVNNFLHATFWEIMVPILVLTSAVWPVAMRLAATMALIERPRPGADG